MSIQAFLKWVREQRPSVHALLAATVVLSLLLLLSFCTAGG